MVFNQNIFHIDAKRFELFISDLIGLPCDQVNLHLTWHKNKTIAKTLHKSFITGLRKCLSHQHHTENPANNWDLNQLYLAHVEVLPQSAIFSTSCNIRGRGRYGATPHPKHVLLQFVFQQRSKPFVFRDEALNPVESVRRVLREKQRPFATPLEELVNEGDVVGKKVVYC